MVEVVRHQVNGVRLSVVTQGRESALHPATILLPGTGATAEDWEVIAIDLARDRLVHAVNLRGHGDSDWPGTYSIDLMADDIRRLIRVLGAPVDLVGHSLGGLVACRTGALEPSLIRRLVLEDVGLLHPREPAQPERPTGTLEFDWAVVEQVRPEIDAPAAHWPATIGAIASPTLVIGGGPTSFVPQETIEELVDLLADGRRVTIDVGHCVHDAAPEGFTRVVREFLDS